jgi:hypothetical protein
MGTLSENSQRILPSTRVLLRATMFPHLDPRPGALCGLSEPANSKLPFDRNLKQAACFDNRYAVKIYNVRAKSRANLLAG